jgi:hypothetical protein
MTGWIIVGALYALGVGLFHVLGGMAAAAEALMRWGQASAERRTKRPVS